MNISTDNTRIQDRLTKESRGRERKKEREETDRYDLVCYTQIVTVKICKYLND